MKQLPNFDLSIVVPLGDRLESFVDSLPLRDGLLRTERHRGCLAGG